MCTTNNSANDNSTNNKPANQKPVYCLKEIAKHIGGLIKSGDPDSKIVDIRPLDEAGPEHIAFISDKKYLKQLETTKAGAIIVGNDFEIKETQKVLVSVKNPYAAFAKTSQLFNPPKRKKGVSQSVTKGEQVEIGTDVYLGPNVVLGDFVKIGNNVCIEANTVIGDHVTIDDETMISPNVTIMQGCKIGKRVRIHSGTVIGSDGFGFAPEGKLYVKIPQLGIVRIDDDVEIGANNTIDRATFGETHIKRGVKTDNLVHIAHNVVVGEDTILVAQVGIAGSTKIGDHVIIAGQTGIGGHLTIGNNAIIGPKSGVAQDLPDGNVVSGVPAIPHKQWLKVQRTTPMLPDMKKLLTKLEQRLNELEQTVKA